ncbi:hypothetical protein [Microbispora rosea]|uniref:hypothetical protein n=1 Tax=Microbispora rosea TaxID=58117 RepID=UPI003D8CBA64
MTIIAAPGYRRISPTCRRGMFRSVRDSPKTNAAAVRCVAAIRRVVVAVAVAVVVVVAEAWSRPMRLGRSIRPAGQGLRATPP